MIDKRSDQCLVITSFQETCILALATEFAGDRMNLINFVGLIVCLTGIAAHVWSKANKGLYLYQVQQYRTRCSDFWVVMSFTTLVFYTSTSTGRCRLERLKTIPLLNVCGATRTIQLKLFLNNGNKTKRRWFPLTPKNSNYKLIFIFLLRISFETGVSFSSSQQIFNLPAKL